MKILKSSIIAVASAAMLSLATAVRSDTIQMDFRNGAPQTTGQVVTFNGLKPTLTNASPATAAATKKIVVLGSSVALGYGSSPTLYYHGSYTNGYAGLLTSRLAPGGWTVTNISIGGQITANGLARFSPELVPQTPSYVLIGYSLANEGLVGATDPERLLNKFTANLTNLIGQCRSHGIYPVVALCYPNNGYSPAEYQYVKSANLAINRMPVPCINFLGALDDGHGHWVNGYDFDRSHPNNAGFQEMFSSFVPTLFDALAAGKPLPRLATVTRFARLTPDAGVPAPITFTPADPMPAFTMAFRMRSRHSGTIAAVRSGTGTATLEIRADQLVYVASTGQELACTVNATNGDWHEVALTHSHARGNTTLIVDGTVAGTVAEHAVPEQFVLGGPGAAAGRPATPAAVDFQNWCLYRAAWNQDEAAAQMQGTLQQASLEICAPLDDAVFAAGIPATNRAQSLAVAQVHTANLSARQEAAPPSQLSAQPLATAALILSWVNPTVETELVVQRRLAGTTQIWSDLASLPAGSTTFTNAELTPGLTYEYRVAAQAEGLRSSASAPVKFAPGSQPSILIDFGPNDDRNGNFAASPDYLGQYWNTLYGPGGGGTPVITGSGLAHLITTNNIATPIGLTVSSNFFANGTLNGGLLAPSYALLGNFAVTNATEDYFFTTATAGASVTLTNLDANAVYRLRLFGTRNTDAATVRTTQFVVTGGNGSFTNTLQTSGDPGWTNHGSAYYGNNHTIVSVSGVIPDGNRQIQVVLTSPTGGFAYLGIMEITPSEPQPDHH